MTIHTSTYNHGKGRKQSHGIPKVNKVYVVYDSQLLFYDLAELVEKIIKECCFIVVHNRSITKYIGF